MALIVVAVFVFAIVRFYQPGDGFTALIGFPRGDSFEPAALRGIPHYEYPALSYDGQFYATRSLDPMLTDPAMDSQMDNAPFRARRILFSWTAYLAGFGRPALILNAYALQNAVAWLLLALLLCRWIPPTTPRGLAVWSASLLSHGLMWSVRFALLDGPSLLLIAIAVLLVEDRRTWASAAVAGIAGLARETNVLAALAQPFPQRAVDWLRAVVVAAPLLVWLDYLRSIYRSTLFSGTSGEIGVPGVGLAQTASATWHLLRTHGVLSAAGLNVCILVPLLIQAVFLVRFRHWRDPWWRVAAGYAALMAILPAVLWAPETGAVSRVMLPLT
ncbi:MAG TPA: hypothetical protein VGL62_04520, partial [Vicinamibacterales bacterium]